MTVAALLTGCAGRSTGGAEGTETDTATVTDSPTATASPTATDSPTATESGDGYGDGYGSGGDDYDTATPTEEPTPTATAEPTATATDEPTATATPRSVNVVLNNVGARAWRFGDSGVAGDGENPTLTLEPGTRYVVENRGYGVHPFALLDGSGSPLLSQDATGGFEDDPAVAWRDDGSEFAFTVTSELAAAAESYVCTVHGAMRGTVETA
ncbi:hypothetical protein [Halobaculum sp. MBLA0143]|uniref:hypothetical protein n=1 Tax=Halobaculum sp. MBLA0143 TaxID=3079933 RepID=UPI0035242CC0